MNKKEGQNSIPELYNLGPNSNALNHEYKVLLDQVFANESDRTNIALSGPYGAGKSSILLSYEKSNPKLKFLHISLGRFEPIDKDGQRSQSSESILERKIVNQLLHLINPANIPQSLFSIKSTLNKYKIFLFSLLVVIFVCSGYLTFNFRDFISLIHEEPFATEIMKNTIFQWIPRISASLFCGIGISLVYLFIKQWKIHRPFSKMKFAGNEIEFAQDNDLPFFDKYLDEILYLFKNAKVDAVVFEDIDRFDDVEVFERLREINNLLNETRDAKSDKRLRFIYLVKDDIFSTVDRVKFFDTIIPIVPIINSANSYDKFVEGLKRLAPDSSINSSFLKSIALHITDMRLVENICNEFMVYSRVLNTLNLDQNKLFALIVYKNIFPRDFSLLQQNKGYVHELFKSVHYYAESLKHSLNSTIEGTKTKIDNTESEITNSLEELDFLYQQKYGINRYPNNHNQTLKLEYNRRRENVQNRGNLYRLQHSLLDAKTKLASIDNIRLTTLIHEGNISEDDIFNFKNIDLRIDSSLFADVTKSPMFDLLRYLLISGYIDETYGNYLTFFYAAEMSPGDMNFVLGVLDGKSANATYSIMNPQQVAASIPVEFFSKKQILNYSLVHYLVDTNDNRLSYIINYLDTNRDYAFVNSYLQQKPNDIRSFTDAICKHWESFFECCKYDNIISDDIMRRIVSCAVIDCSSSKISALNKDQAITDYVNSTGCLLNIDFDFNEANVISNIDVLGIKIDSVEITDATNQSMLATIYENNAYRVTFMNVCQMYRCFYKQDQETLSEMERKPLSLIFSKETSYLTKYVNDNLTEFLADWLLVCKTCTDDERVAIEVLNSGSLDDQRENYLNVLRTKITHVENICNGEIRGFALQNGNVEFSTHNLIVLFKLDGNTDGSVSDLIQNSDSQIMVSEDDKEERNSLIESLVRNEEISDEKISHIIRACHFLYESFTESSLPPNRLILLIQIDAVCMNIASYSYIHNWYAQTIHLEYVKRNFDDYLRLLMSGEGYFQDDVIAILCSDMFTKGQRGQLLEIVVKIGDLQLLPPGFPYKEDTIYKAISLDIIDQAGFSALFNKDTPLTKQERNAIVRLAISSWDSFITKCAPVANESLCGDILQNQKVDISHKKQLFILRLRDFSNDFILKSLKAAGFDEIASCFNQSTSLVPESTENTQVLAALQEKNMITFSQAEQENYLVTIANINEIES